MRPALLLVFASALGCSPNDPDDVFYWLGRVADASGGARAGATATLASASDQRAPSCSPADRLELLFSPTDDTYSLGKAGFAEVRRATADDTGAFYFDLMRFEINPTPDDIHCFRVAAQGPGGTSARSATFGLPKDLQFPDLAQWAPALAVAPGSPAQLALPDLPWAPSREPAEIEPGHARSAAYAWVLAAPDGAIAWEQVTLGDPLALDPDLLEDFSGLTASLEAWMFDQVERHGPFGTTDVSQYWTDIQAPGPSLAAGTTAPVSRGAACTFNGAPFAGCPLTDGSLALATLPTWFQPGWHPDPSQPDGPTDVVVFTLPRAAVPRRLVMRDVFSNYSAPGVIFTVEGSADGTTWFPLAQNPVYGYPTAEAPGADAFSGSGAHVAWPLDSGGQAVQQVRITSNPYSALLAAREISIFE